MNFLFLLVGFFPTFWNVARGPAHERLGWVRRRGQWPLQWALRRRHGGPSLLLLLLLMLLLLLLLLLLMSLLLLPDGVAQSHPFLRFVCVSVLVCVVRVRWFLSLWKRWIIVDIKNRLASIDCIMGRRYNTTKPCFYRIFPIVSLRKKNYDFGDEATVARATKDGACSFFPPGFLFELSVSFFCYFMPPDFFLTGVTWFSVCSHGFCFLSSVTEFYLVIS